MMNTKKFNTRVLAALFTLAFLFINAAWTPQTAAAQAEVIVPAQTADTTDDAPPSNWGACNSWQEPGYSPVGCREAAHAWQDARPSRPEPPALDATDAAWAAWAASAIPGGMSETTTCGLAPSTCRPPACTLTAEPVYGEWSEWTFDLETGREFRTRTVLITDAYDNSVVCDEFIETEWRPGASCTLTAEPIYGEWSEWTFDLETGREFRTRTVLITDAYDNSVVCDEFIETEWRPGASCTLTAEPIYGEWSEWVYNPATSQEERYRTVTVLDEYDSTIVCAEFVEIEGRPVAPSCTKDQMSTVYITVTAEGKPLEGQRVALDVDMDGIYEYVDTSNHSGQLMFHVDISHWSRHSALVYLGDDREVDAQEWNDVAYTWGDDQSGKPADEQRFGWLWGLTDCISAFGQVHLGSPTPINPPVAALPAAPCEEQGG